MSTSIFLTVLLLFGSGGVIQETHSCIHCGIDISIPLFAYAEESGDSCCSVPADQQSCELENQSCCQFEVERIGVSEQLPALKQLTVKSLISSPYSPEIQINHKPLKSGFELVLPPTFISGKDKIIQIARFRA